MVMYMLEDGGEDAQWMVVLAHGAGAPVDTPWMEAFALGLASPEVRVVRFEFAYMAQRRNGGKKRPPPRTERLLDEWRALLAELAWDGPLVLGGKSMGGRIASMLVDEVGASGLLCLGYPFHPPGKPEKLRIAHLKQLVTPTLIIQGERDPFGRQDEVQHYELSEQIRIHWLPDGEHSFKPRKASGYTLEENLQAGVEAARGFLRGLMSQ